ncbi:MAG TPA: alginate lyase family protein [Candidatus Limnocylindrales bacterium]|nr:alginate lyase family protein [Candidatus Limnocylindrales bacterium]
MPSVPPLVGPDAGFLVTSAELQQRAALAAQGEEPYREAVADLLTFAHDALVAEPHPEQPLDILGTTGPFVDDTAAAYGLALAYGLTGDAADATKAAHHIMAWVDTTTTTVNACPDSGACQTSLIISRAAPGFVFAAALLAPSGALSAEDTARFKAWLRAIILPAASRLENNWGDAGTFTRLAVTAYLEDQEGFAAAVAKWRAQQDLIATDGHIPLEVRRESAGIGYTQEALDYKVAGAEIAARQGVDLWDYRGVGGATLRDAVDYLADYWFDPHSWPWYPDPTSPPLSGMWEIAYQHWPTPAWQPIIEQRRPYDAQGHSAVRWTTLTNGLPFDGSAGDPTPSH